MNDAALPAALIPADRIKIAALCGILPLSAHQTNPRTRAVLIREKEIPL
jgi:hypothetical protein